MELNKAKEIANSLYHTLKPYCEKIGIAGSVRREKEHVKDIEIVAIPTPRYAVNLFGDRTQEGWEIDYPLNKMTLDGWQGVKGGEKYKQLYHPGHDLKLDLFLVTPPAQWGVIYTIRTGSADFSHWIVTPRKYGGGLPSDCHVKDGAVWRGSEIIPMDEETDFLAFCGLGWIEPSARIGKVSLQHV